MTTISQLFLIFSMILSHQDHLAGDVSLNKALRVAAEMSDTQRTTSVENDNWLIASVLLQGGSVVVSLMGSRAETPKELAGYTTTALVMSVSSWAIVLNVIAKQNEMVRKEQEINTKVIESIRKSRSLSKDDVANASQ